MLLEIIKEMSKKSKLKLSLFIIKVKETNYENIKSGLLMLVKYIKQR